MLELGLRASSAIAVIAVFAYFTPFILVPKPDTPNESDQELHNEFVKVVRLLLILVIIGFGSCMILSHQV